MTNNIQAGVRADRRSYRQTHSQTRRQIKTQRLAVKQADICQQPEIGSKGSGKKDMGTVKQANKGRQAEPVV